MGQGVTSTVGLEPRWGMFTGSTLGGGDTDWQGHHQIPADLSLRVPLYPPCRTVVSWGLAVGGAALGVPCVL